MVESQPQANRVPLPGSQVRGVFVGRQRELEEMRAALDDVLSGRGRIVMLAGEPGIGKTRTAQEVAVIAGQCGCEVLWGRCHEGEGVPPYWPWAQPIRSYVQRTETDQLLSHMGPGATYIAQIIPDLENKLPNLEPAPALEPAQARFRLFDSISTFLKNASQEHPLVLVLEDLHWADRSSLLLFEFIAGEISASRLLLVGIYRDVELSRSHPLSQTLGGLIREQSFQNIRLSGLTRQDVSRFVEGATGVTPDLRLVESIHRQTEGNPLFVGELVRLLSREEIERGQNRNFNVPQGVRDAIGRRLERLSERCNQVLTIASIIGREFNFKLLGTFSELSDNQLLEVLDEALESHVIEEVAEPVEHYQFSHVLIRQTLYEELSASRRVRLHARFGEVLERLYGSDPNAYSAELAHHFAEAAPVLGTEKLVRYSYLAGEQALAARAYEEAQAYFERALVAKEDQGMDSEMADLLFGLGRAQAAILERFQMSAVVDTLTRAFNFYADGGNSDRAVAIAEYHLPPVPGQHIGVTQLINRALALVPPESQEAASLLSRYGWELGVEMGDYGGAQAAFRRADEIAQSNNNLILQMRVLASAAQVDWWHLHCQGCVEKSLRVIELARDFDDLYTEVSARYFAVQALVTIGDSEVILKDSAALLDAAERLRNRHLLGSALFTIGTVAFVRGEWEVARGYIDRGLAISPQDPRLLTTRILLEYEEDAPGWGETYLAQFLQIMNSTPPGPVWEYAYIALVMTLAARITNTTDHLDVAEAAAATVLSSPSATPLYAGVARAALGLLASLRLDVAAASEQYGPLELIRGTIPSRIITVDRVLGLLAQTMGKLDDAVAHFEEALTVCRRAGYKSEYAWSCHDYADVLLQRNGSGDREKAISLLEESLKLSQELAMRPLNERVSAVKGRIESEQQVAPIYPNGLSHREVEVLRLLAAGKTNRQIGEELFISLNTVERHVSNIFSKVGTANRADATRYAIRNGLIS